MTLEQMDGVRLVAEAAWAWCLSLCKHILGDTVIDCPPEFVGPQTLRGDDGDTDFVSEIESEAQFHDCNPLDQQKVLEPLKVPTIATEWTNVTGPQWRRSQSVEKSGETFDSRRFSDLRDFGYLCLCDSRRELQKGHGRFHGWHGSAPRSSRSLGIGR